MCFALNISAVKLLKGNQSASVAGDTNLYDEKRIDMKAVKCI